MSDEEKFVFMFTFNEYDVTKIIQHRRCRATIHFTKSLVFIIAFLWRVYSECLYIFGYLVQILIIFGYLVQVLIIILGYLVHYWCCVYIDGLFIPGELMIKTKYQRISKIVCITGWYGMRI